MGPPKKKSSTLTQSNVKFDEVSEDDEVNLNPRRKKPAAKTKNSPREKGKEVQRRRKLNRRKLKKLLQPQLDLKKTTMKFYLKLKA